MRLGHTAEKDFFNLCEAVDVGINLRYPSAGETSGITIRLLGMGKPVIVSEGPETSTFPDGACLKLPVDASEEALLCEYMIYLAENPAKRHAMGRKASSHIAEFHSLDVVAQRYFDVLIS